MHPTHWLISTQVDGGIKATPETIGACAAAGANCFIAGSGMFKYDDLSVGCKELREIASKEAGNADEAFVMAIAQKAIRQALDSGVIPPQLQPKPERPTVVGD